MSNIDIIGQAFTSNKPYLFRALFDWILDNNGTPYLVVDATRERVKVPLEHVKDGQIVLNIAPSAVHNWIADNDAISFSARFSGKPKNMFIPMDSLRAIYAQENGQGMAFPEELLDDKDFEKTDDAKKESENSKDKLGVAAVLDGNTNNVDNNESSTKKAKVTHLKVVK